MKDAVIFIRSSDLLHSRLSHAIARKRDVAMGGILLPTPIKYQFVSKSIVSANRQWFSSASSTTKSIYRAPWEKTLVNSSAGRLLFDTANAKNNLKKTHRKNILKKINIYRIHNMADVIGSILFFVKRILSFFFNRVFA